MLIDRVYLRNYRVFEEELDLALPPGLVGVYGPNGAGKSTLLESILWALWGYARTPKDGVRSSGARGDCIAEVTFEHEGHIYLVRRTISGIASTVKAQAHCDGLAMAEGARDTTRYVHSVLGMDDAAFRASVFAEQKQLAAFSQQGPADRRKLVLSLLGITPLDAARDRARADARERAQEHSRLRGMLADIEEARVAAADAEAKASAAEVSAEEEKKAAAAARERAEAARQAFSRYDLVRQEHEQLIVQGRGAKAELASANKQVAELTAELESLAASQARLAELAPLAGQVHGADRRAQLLRTLTEAARTLASQPEAAEPEAPDEQSLATAERAARQASSALGAAQGTRQAAEAELMRSKTALARSAELSDEGECPLCGQALGEAFAQVQAHRNSELQTAQSSLANAESALAKAEAAAAAALDDLKRTQAAVERTRAAHLAWQKSNVLRAGALQRYSSALSALREALPSDADKLGPSPSAEMLSAALVEAQADLEAAQAACEEANRLSGKLERREYAQNALEEAKARAATAQGLVETLRTKVKGLGYDAEVLASTQSALAAAQSSAQLADAAARAAEVEAATARATANAEAKRLADAQAQHARLGELQSLSLHLSRTAELLNAFRNSVVASVGPRLAVQAAELFGELTNNEYDRLEVDPDTYDLQICDAGVSYDLRRFSGSEEDLANLALRVAISEHVRFQSGGMVGLLVLDEVFGPLDDERRAQMLLALERLRGRFRQVLVVTHSTEVKEQLPSAIEVLKKPGRRATARVIEQI